MNAEHAGAMFARQYRVVFPDLDFEFTNISNEDATRTQEGLHIAFKIEKDLTKETNKCTLTLWNISDDTYSKITEPDTKVEIYAGYAYTGRVMRVFVGTITDFEMKSSDKDLEVELRLSDGQIAVRDTMVSLSFPEGTYGTEIINSIANQMGLPVIYGADVSLGAYWAGYSFIGAGADALTEICGAFGVDWSIQNEIIQVVLNGGYSEQQGFVFSADSGLIGSPEKLVRASPKADTETTKKKKRKLKKKAKLHKYSGWKIKTLMTPSINPADFVKVESRLVNGWFKVEKVQHSGDSMGGDWFSEFELLDAEEAAAQDAEEAKNEAEWQEYGTGSDEDGTDE